jgi:hypothetical protein
VHAVFALTGDIKTKLMIGSPIFCVGMRVSASECLRNTKPIAGLLLHACGLKKQNISDRITQQ